MSGSAARRDRPSVLVTTSSFPRWENDTDPRFIEELCFELAAGFDVTVLAPHCAGAAREETLTRHGRSVKVHRYRYCLPAFENLTYAGGIAARLRQNPLRILLVPLLLAAQLIAVTRLCRQRRFDALHAHWIVPQGLVAALHRRFARSSPPLLLTVHGSDAATLDGPVGARLKRRILLAADRITTVSEALCRDLVDLGCPPERIVVRSMGVDLGSRFTPGEHGARSGIVCIGKLTAKKGVDVLLDAFALLRAGHRAQTLTLIGDGEERGALEQKAHALGIADQVNFAGAIRQEDIPAVLRRASVAAMPSLEEGLGLVTVEAMGCGCAVVASDLPALRDVIVDGETGLLAEPGDPAALAERIGRLLDDDGLRSRLAAAGREFVLRRFDWQVVGADYRELLLSLA